jgi:hypothetical protein
VTILARRSAPGRTHPGLPWGLDGEGWDPLRSPDLADALALTFAEPVSGTSSRMNFGKVLTYPRASVA